MVGMLGAQLSYDRADVGKLWQFQIDLGLAIEDQVQSSWKIYLNTDVLEHFFDI